MLDSNSFTKDLVVELERCAKNYSDDNNAISSESKTIFKGQVKTFDNVRVHNFDVYFNSYIVRFCYYPHIPFTTSHSTLTCFISLEKAESQRLFYPVSHICAYIVFLALTVHQNVKLTVTGVYDNTSFWEIHGDYYSYDEIDKVYYRAQTPNGYGDMLDIPSYVIRFKNGKELDPYSLNTCDEKLLNTMRDRDIFVESP